MHTNQPRMEACIFGAGSGGQRTLDFYGRRFRVTAFADNDVTKHGRRVAGREVIPPGELMRRGFDRIIVGSQHHAAISRQLLELGLPAERILIADPEVLAGLYRVPRSLKIGVGFAGVVLVLAAFGAFKLLLS